MRRALPVPFRYISPAPERSMDDFEREDSP